MTDEPNEDAEYIPADPSFLLSEATYKKLKWLVQYLLPSASTLYFTIGELWGLPSVKEVNGTVAAITAFLAVILGISTRTYNRIARYGGTIVIEEKPNGAKVYNLVLNQDDPNDIDMMDEITFKIQK